MSTDVQAGKKKLLNFATCLLKSVLHFTNGFISSYLSMTDCHCIHSITFSVWVLSGSKLWNLESAGDRRVIRNIISGAATASSGGKNSIYKNCFKGMKRQFRAGYVDSAITTT